MEQKPTVDASVLRTAQRMHPRLGPYFPKAVERFEDYAAREIGNRLVELVADCERSSLIIHSMPAELEAAKLAAAKAAARLSADSKMKNVKTAANKAAAVAMLESKLAYAIQQLDECIERASKIESIYNKIVKDSLDYELFVKLLQTVKREADQAAAMNPRFTVKAGPLWFEKKPDGKLNEKPDEVLNSNERLLALLGRVFPFKLEREGEGLDLSLCTEDVVILLVESAASRDSPPGIYGLAGKSLLARLIAGIAMLTGVFTATTGCGFRTRYGLTLIPLPAEQEMGSVSFFDVEKKVAARLFPALDRKKEMHFFTLMLHVLQMLDLFNKDDVICETVLSFVRATSAGAAALFNASKCTNCASVVCGNGVDVVKPPHFCRNKNCKMTMCDACADDLRKSIEPGKVLHTGDVACACGYVHPWLPDLPRLADVDSARAVYACCLKCRQVRVIDDPTACDEAAQQPTEIICSMCDEWLPITIQCPCGAVFSHSEDCLHMTCRSSDPGENQENECPLGLHYCGWCGSGFDTSHEVYDHLSQKTCKDQRGVSCPGIFPPAPVLVGVQAVQVVDEPVEEDYWGGYDDY